MLLAFSCAGIGPGSAVEPLPMQEVAEGVFVHQASHALATHENAGIIGNVGFVVGRDAVAVIDTGGSRVAGERLLAAIRARTDLPVRYVINTHMHPDHVLGNVAFSDEKPDFTAHRNQPRALAARAQAYRAAGERQLGEAFAGTSVIIPKTVVHDRLTIDLGERVLHLRAMRTAHTDNDLTILDERTGTLFVGDLLFMGHLPVIDGNLLGWRMVMRELREISARRVVPGHGPASAPWPESLAPQERYLARLEDDVRMFIREGRTITEAADRAAESERASWDLFEAFNRRNAIAAYHELEWE